MEGRPKTTEKWARWVIEDHWDFGVVVNATPLPSDRDQNWLIQLQCSENPFVMLKIANEDMLEETLKVEEVMLSRLSCQISSGRVPNVVIPKELFTIEADSEDSHESIGLECYHMLKE